MCVGKTSVHTHTPIKPKFLNRKSAVKRVQLMNETGKIAYQDDILAVTTYYTKVALFTANDFLQSFAKSTAYKILFKTTQPAHVLTALAVVTIAYLLLPSQNASPSLASPFWTFIYLASFSAHFGAQMWMTFISGLSLYFTLPRHTFGNIQQVLFPKYFLLNSILSLITLTVFIKGNNGHLTTPQITTQVSAMTLCFLTELIIRLYLTPPLLLLMTIKNKIEKEAGIGMEVGKLVAGDLLKCPHYVKIHKSFRKVHMTIAIGNIVAMSCTILHLYYLAHKICVFN